MTDHGAHLAGTWNEVVSELLAASEQPDSAVPTFNSLQTIYLRMIRPAVIVDGYAVLTVPQPEARDIIERDLAPYITEALSKRMGQPCVLAVTVELTASARAAQRSPESPAPKAPQAPERRETFPAPTQHDADFGSSGPDQAPLWTQHVIPPQDSPGRAQNRTGSETPTRGQPAEFQDQFSRGEQPRTTPEGSRLYREKPAHDPNRETSLNPKYTFETFVVGSSNRFANSAAVAVAETPARAYNPLFIWGGSGLGKTHLLHAAGNYAKVLQPGLRIKYVSSEEFTNDYINSVRDDRQESFKRRYRNLDVLMVDDIQFLEGKEGTQEEFFHTFNALHQQNKQIILSSDRPPRQLTTLEDRLRTRFEGGLITDVQPPDLETRIAILEKKAVTDGNRVDRDILEFIASQFESSIRELEGALIRVTAYASLIHEPITMEGAHAALRDIAPDGGDVEITADVIKTVTAEYFDIDMDKLTGKAKVRHVAHARQLAMYLCRELTELSLPNIGKEFGGKDHTTVMYADKKIRAEMTEKRETYDEIQALTQLIKSRHRV